MVITEPTWEIIRIARILQKLDRTEQGRDITGLLDVVTPKVLLFIEDDLRIKSLRQLARFVFYSNQHFIGKPIPDTPEEIVAEVNEYLQKETALVYDAGNRGIVGRCYSCLRENTPENQLGDWRMGQEKIAIQIRLHDNSPIDIKDNQRIVWDSF